MLILWAPSLHHHKPITPSYVWRHHTHHSTGSDPITCGLAHLFLLIFTSWGVEEKGAEGGREGGKRKEGGKRRERGRWRGRRRRIKRRRRGWRGKRRRRRNERRRRRLRRQWRLITFQEPQMTSEFRGCFWTWTNAWTWGPSKEESQFTTM